MGRSEVREYDVPSMRSGNIKSNNEIDVHGLTASEAVVAVKNMVNAANSSIYRIKVIHGYNGGTAIQSALRDEFSYGRVAKVKRVTMGDNPGVTELILREY